MRDAKASSTVDRPLRTLPSTTLMARSRHAHRFGRGGCFGVLRIRTFVGATALCLTVDLKSEGFDVCRWSMVMGDGARRKGCAHLCIQDADLRLLGVRDAKAQFIFNKF